MLVSNNYFISVYNFYVVFMTIVIYSGRVCRADDAERRLMKHLMADYDPAVRPVANASEVLTVTFGAALYHIIDVDERNQILTTNCWLTQIWTDHHLKWNKSEYGGIHVIRIPYNRVWLPDVILYNNADSTYQTAVINTNVIVQYTGEVVWLSHGIYKSSCEINVEYFPFDSQDCYMKWASWTYDGYQVELVKQTEEGDVSNYKANGEFDLISFESEKHNVIYSCCPEPYPDITYTIKLRRRPMFYVFNLILPCILINGVALLVFYVPSESGEKVTLGISALLSMTVFLMTIRETLPPTEKTPLISLYYGASICLVSFASGLSVVTLNIYYRGVRGGSVPSLIRTVVLNHLARFVFMSFEKAETKRTPQNRLFAQISPRFIPRNLRTEENDSYETRIIRILNKVHASIDRNEQRVTEQERRELTELEWKQASLVLDRLLFTVFFLITVITTSAILCGGPAHQHGS